MKKKGYYSSGQFAKMAGVSLRTVRYYDKRDVLKPSCVSEAGARFYTDSDFAKLQQILLFKYLGFSLEEIKELTIGELDSGFMANTLNMQMKLVRDRIEQMQLVEKAIEDMSDAIESKEELDYSKLLELIHLTGMEKSMKSQYQDASNISARIRLHKLYSQNEERWFPWVYRQIESAYPIHNKAVSILEIGCGNGALWEENIERIPKAVSVVLSDKSEGMLRDARRALGFDDARFTYKMIDCHQIPYEEKSFDIVVANHVMFYCEDMEKALKEVYRVLKPNGVFVCSTYGANHMREISELVQEFDNRIVLAAEKLFERFGLENGEGILKSHFEIVECIKHEDFLEVTNGDHLAEYIISCHGNQNQYLLERYKEFRRFVDLKMGNAFHITKDAGIFICKK